jgi:uncharacterized protein (DUF885 family)
MEKLSRYFTISFMFVSISFLVLFFAFNSLDFQAEVITPQENQSLTILATGLEELPIDEFFELSFQRFVLRDIEMATKYGFVEPFDEAYEHLTNISDAYIRETQSLEVATLYLLRQYDYTELTPEQKLSAQIYEWYLSDRVRGHGYMYHNYPVNQVYGIQMSLIDYLTSDQPITDEYVAYQYISRLSRVDEKFDQLLESLRLREQAGIIPPKYIIQTVLAQTRPLAYGDVESHPVYIYFKSEVEALDNINDLTRKRLLAFAGVEVRNSVVPAYQALIDYFEYLYSYADEDAGVWKLPDGEDYYNYLLHHHTTTQLTVNEIHQIGLDEVERLQAEIRAEFLQLGYPQNVTLSQLFQWAAMDGGVYALNKENNRDDVLADYQMLIDEMEDNLYLAFELQPKYPIVVLPVPGYNTDSPGGYYVPPGTAEEAGVFYVNLNGIVVPWYTMPTLAFHETYPGHHLQFSVMRGLDDLHTFRKYLTFTAYVEGWAVYAEYLAWEMGVYEGDPYANLGRLQAELFRAARLVVDTGIHAKGWSRTQANSYMNQTVGYPSGSFGSEIDRYIVWPGQATAYKIGMQKILQLRQLAMEELGNQFDLKEFHTVILTNGSMPLEVLEQVIWEYIRDNQSE